MGFYNKLGQWVKDDSQQVGGQPNGNAGLLASSNLMTGINSARTTPSAIWGNNSQSYYGDRAARSSPSWLRPEVPEPLLAEAKQIISGLDSTDPTERINAATQFRAKILSNPNYNFAKSLYGGLGTGDALLAYNKGPVEKAVNVLRTDGDPYNSLGNSPSFFKSMGNDIGHYARDVAPFVLASLGAYGAAAGAGALAGSGSAAGAGAGAGASGGGTGLSMGAQGASGLSAGSTGAAGLNPWVASGTMSAQMPAYAAYGAGAGTGLGAYSSGLNYEGGVNYAGGPGTQPYGTPEDFGASGGSTFAGDPNMPAYTSAQNTAGMAQGGSTSIAPATASNGNLLSNIGGALDQGSFGANLKTYGPVVWAGMEYANARDAAKAYEDQLNQQIQQSDPFGPERAKYQQMLDEHMRNPEAFLSSPQVQFASDAAARKMAAMGYNMSPTQAQAIADASAGEYYKQAELLAGLAGSNIAPNTSGAVNGINSLIQNRMDKNASLGNVARTAVDAFFGGAGSTDSGSTEGKAIGERVFSGIGKLV